MVIEFVFIVGSDSTYTKMDSLAVDCSSEVLNVSTERHSLIEGRFFVIT